jgi:hypothetical protein
MSYAELIWPDYDDVGYEFRREALLEMGCEPAVLRLVPPLPPACTPLVRCEVCRSVMARCFCPFVVAEGLRVAS